jgi:hypothetical protein
MLMPASTKALDAVDPGGQDWITGLDQADQALIGEPFLFVQGAEIDSVLAGLTPRR